MSDSPSVFNQDTGTSPTSPGPTPNGGFFGNAGNTISGGLGGIGAGLGGIGSGIGSGVGKVTDGVGQNNPYALYQQRLAEEKAKEEEEIKRKQAQGYTTKKHRYRILPLELRSTHEERGSGMIEILFDLIFAVSIDKAQDTLQDIFSNVDSTKGERLIAIAQYFVVFFILWWPWQSTAFFLSAYDTEDALFIIAVLFLMVGNLIISIGIEKWYDRDSLVVIIGLCVQRVTSVLCYWVRLRCSKEVNHVRHHTRALRSIGVEVVCTAYWIGITVWNHVGYKNSIAPRWFIAVLAGGVLLEFIGEQWARGWLFQFLRHGCREEVPKEEEEQNEAEHEEELEKIPELTPEQIAADPGEATVFEKIRERRMEKIEKMRRTKSTTRRFLNLPYNAHHIADRNAALCMMTLGLSFVYIIDSINTTVSGGSIYGLLIATRGGAFAIMIFIWYLYAIWQLPALHTKRYVLSVFYMYMHYFIVAAVAAVVGGSTACIHRAQNRVDQLDGMPMGYATHEKLSEQVNDYPIAPEQIYCEYLLAVGATVFTMSMWLLRLVLDNDNAKYEKEKKGEEFTWKPFLLQFLRAKVIIPLALTALLLASPAISDATTLRVANDFHNYTDANLNFSDNAMAYAGMDSRNLTSSMYDENGNIIRLAPNGVPISYHIPVKRLVQGPFIALRDAVFGAPSSPLAHENGGRSDLLPSDPDAELLETISRLQRDKHPKFHRSLKGSEWASCSTGICMLYVAVWMCLWCVQNIVFEITTVAFEKPEEEEESGAEDWSEDSGDGDDELIGKNFPVSFGHISQAGDRLTDNAAFNTVKGLKPFQSHAPDTT